MVYQSDQPATGADARHAFDGASVNVGIKMTRELYERLRKDLLRPHDFAGERVGFLFGRRAAATVGKFVILVDYEPVDDDAYVEDWGVGARINSAAIRRAMQRALNSEECVFHVHLHAHRGRPGFSSVDLHDLDKLVPSFGHVAPEGAHGAIVLSLDCGAALVWPQVSSSPVAASYVHVVGYPLSHWNKHV